MRCLSLTCSLILMCLTTPASAAAEPALDWRRPWIEQHDPRQAVDNPDEYAWRLFVALNWPADRKARTANRLAPLGAPGAVVWEVWRNAADVYLNDGRDPGPWAGGRYISEIADESRFETLSLKDLPNARHIVAGRMVPLMDPLVSAKRLTEIHMNRPAFEFIRTRELYNLDGQLRSLRDRQAVSFPSGAVEVKAKWRPIRDDERGRYHTLTVRFGDGSHRLYGLTALHIISKDLPQWFWATFEHVDNPTLPDSEGWQLPSADHFACSRDPGDCNRAPAGLGLEGTVWQHFRLRGTLTRFVDADSRPLLLANSELEAGLQKTSSCMTCHSRSAITLLSGTPVRLPVLDMSPGSGEPSLANERKGFVGLPLEQWFESSRPGAAPPYLRLDFVWSLSKAQPRRNPHDS